MDLFHHNFNQFNKKTGVGVYIIIKMIDNNKHCCGPRGSHKNTPICLKQSFLDYINIIQETLQVLFETKFLGLRKITAYLGIHIITYSILSVATYFIFPLVFFIKCCLLIFCLGLKEFIYASHYFVLLLCFFVLYLLPDIAIPIVNCNGDYRFEMLLQ